MKFTNLLYFDRHHKPSFRGLVKTNDSQGYNRRTETLQSMVFYLIRSFRSIFDSTDRHTKSF